MQLDEVSRLIIQKLENMVDTDLIQGRRKAISVLFPYAVFLERRGQQGMIDAFSRVARASNYWTFMRRHVKPFIITLFSEPDPPSLNWLLGLISPRILWHNQSHINSIVPWRASAPLHTEEVCRNVANEVLQIAFTTSQQSITPPFFPRRSKGAEGGVVRQVRALKDLELLKSYLLLVWSEWVYIDDPSGGLAEMQATIREDFGGIGMWRHRKDLIKRLDHVLWRLGD